MRKTWLPWLILSPSLLFLLLFTWFPLGRSVYDSLFDTRMVSDGGQYVGLENFSRLFADSVFWQSLGNNLLYILLTVIPGVTLALLLAVALTENHRVNRWLRTAFFFPMIIPMVSAAALWLFIYSITQIDHVAVMTRGGPDNATTVLLYYIQNLAWDTHDLGKASAATFLTLAGLFAFSLINLKLLEKGAHYER